jgi:hypothetical protein
MNFDKTNFMQFTTKNSPQIDLDVSYTVILIFKAYDTKFLGLYVDRTMSWRLNVEQITHKLNAACYAVRSVNSFMSQETLKVVYYAFISFSYELWIKILGEQEKFLNIKEYN